MEALTESQEENPTAKEIGKILVSKGYKQVSDIHYEGHYYDFASGTLGKLVYKIYPEWNELGTNIEYFKCKLKKKDPSQPTDSPEEYESNLLLSGYWTDTKDFLQEPNFKL